MKQMNKKVDFSAYYQVHQILVCQEMCYHAKEIKRSKTSGREVMRAGEG